MKGISYRPLADMHTDGVYFDKDEMLLVGDETICQYSGLPSISTFIDNAIDAGEPIQEELVIGHS